MDKVSRGRVRQMKQDVASRVPEGAQVLEIGCGTGELASMLVLRGASVEGFDVNPAMLAAAQERIRSEDLEGRFTVRRMAVDGMDELPAATFDAVVSTLVFSELSDDERRFALEHACRVLRPGGLLVISDEVVPKRPGRKILHALARAPMLAATFLISRSTTHPLRDIEGEIGAAGFSIQDEVRSHGDAFALIVATKVAA